MDVMARYLTQEQLSREIATGQARAAEYEQKIAEATARRETYRTAYERGEIRLSDYRQRQREIGGQLRHYNEKLAFYRRTTTTFERQQSRYADGEAAGRTRDETFKERIQAPEMAAKRAALPERRQAQERAPGLIREGVTGRVYATNREIQTIGGRQVVIGVRKRPEDATLRAQEEREDQWVNIQRRTTRLLPYVVAPSVVQEHMKEQAAARGDVAVTPGARLHNLSLQTIKTPAASPPRVDGPESIVWLGKQVYLTGEATAQGGAGLIAFARRKEREGLQIPVAHVGGAALQWWGGGLKTVGGRMIDNPRTAGLIVTAPVTAGLVGTTTTAGGGVTAGMARASYAPIVQRSASIFGRTVVGTEIARTTIDTAYAGMASQQQRRYLQVYGDEATALGVAARQEELGGVKGFLYQLPGAPLFGRESLSQSAVREYGESKGLTTYEAQTFASFVETRYRARSVGEVGVNIYTSTATEVAGQAGFIQSVRQAQTFSTKPAAAWYIAKNVGGRSTVLGVAEGAGLAYTNLRTTGMPLDTSYKVGGLNVPYVAGAGVLGGATAGVGGMLIAGSSVVAPKTGRGLLYSAYILDPYEAVGDVTADVIGGARRFSHNTMVGGYLPTSKGVVVKAFTEAPWGTPKPPKVVTPVSFPTTETGALTTTMTVQEGPRLTLSGTRRPTSGMIPSISPISSFVFSPVPSITPSPTSTTTSIRSTTRILTPTYTPTGVYTPTNIFTPSVTTTPVTTPSLTPTTTTTPVPTPVTVPTPTPQGGWFPFIDMWGLRRGKKGRGGAGRKRGFGYSADLWSVTFGERGRARKAGSLGYTGFEARPIPGLARTRRRGR